MYVICLVIRFLAPRKYIDKIKDTILRYKKPQGSHEDSRRKLKNYKWRVVILGYQVFWNIIGYHEFTPHPILSVQVYTLKKHHFLSTNV